MSLAKITAVNWVELTKVVVRALPLKLTVAPLTKPVPLAVNEKVAEPAAAFAGWRDVNTGAALLAALIVKVRVLEVPPPGDGLVTVTPAVPAAATSLARTEAVSCVELTNVVTRLLPLKLTVAPLTNPVPFTVNAKAGEPAVALDGCRDVSASEAAVTFAASWFTVKDWQPAVIERVRLAPVFLVTL
jgi:hypothetical protein